jgi:hypothetical protein
MPAKRSSLRTIGAFAPDDVAEEAEEKKPGSRAGKRCVPIWIPIAAKRQLAMMAAEKERTLQDLLTEALNDLFKKEGKPPIA